MGRNIIPITWEQLQERDLPNQYQMAISKKQDKIIKYLIEHKKITKSEAIGLVGDQYHNKGKYVGEILTRMIESNLIERVKRGVYELKSKSVSNNKQLNLF